MRGAARKGQGKGRKRTPLKSRGSDPQKAPPSPPLTRGSRARNEKPVPGAPPAAIKPLRRRKRGPERGQNKFTGAENPPTAPKARKPRKRRDVLSWWYAVRTKSGRERWARRHVERSGHQVFSPWIEEEGRPREQPLFPGYIFVLGPDWYYLQQTPGILAPIMMGSVPARMPIVEIKRLMSWCDREGVITIKRETFTKGQGIRVRRGSWQGHKGTYIRATGPERVRVLMQMLGGVHEFEFDRAAITGAADGQDPGAKANPDGGATST